MKAEGLIASTGKGRGAKWLNAAAQTIKDKYQISEHRMITKTT
jgi:hypothetical protein